MTNSALYEGWVRHRRFAPVSHELRLGLFMTYLDLGELPSALDAFPLASARRPAITWFRREDHFGDASEPLDTAVRNLVERRAGVRPSGSIRLLTVPRTWGLWFNPVSFFFCFDAQERLVAVVAEVTNTPWRERHLYVISSDSERPPAPLLRQRFSKAFHVSPFLGMDLEYDWRFQAPGRLIVVQMTCRQAGKLVLDATLRLERRRLDASALAAGLIRYPAIALRTLGWIYYNALVLWLKRAPFHPHPGKRARRDDIRPSHDDSPPSHAR